MKKFFCLFIASSVLSATAAMAQYLNMTVEGTTQGAFKSESSRAKQGEKIDILAYVQELTAAREAASGLATGRRQHMPFVIYKQSGASSPQFMQALVTNEMLKKVIVNVYKVDMTGQEVLF